MRSLRFLPLVFVAGVDGFAMFIPYMLFVWTIALVVERTKMTLRPAAIV
jgi:hypothetical protein